MNLSTFAIVIGVLSCISNTILSGITIAGLVVFHQHAQEHRLTLSAVFDDGSLAVLIISLILYVIMFALSILMIVGVQKKRQEWIGPWVILSAIDIICSIVYFFMRGFDRSSGDIILSLVFIAVSCLVWYPIYTLWIVMRNATVNSVSHNQHPASSPPYDPMPVYPTTEELKKIDYIPHTQNI